MVEEPPWVLMASEMLTCLVSALACLTLSLFMGNEQARPNQPYTFEQSRQWQEEQRGARAAQQPPMNEVPTVFEQVQAPRQTVICETVKSAAVASTRTAPLSSTKSTSTQQSSKSRGKYATSDEDNAKTEFEKIQAIVRPAVSRKSKSQRLVGKSSSATSSDDSKVEAEKKRRRRKKHHNQTQSAVESSHADTKRQQLPERSTETPSSSSASALSCYLPIGRTMPMHTHSVYLPIMSAGRPSVEQQTPPASRIMPAHSVYLPVSLAGSVEQQTPNTGKKASRAKCSPDTVTPPPSKPPSPPNCGKYATDDEKMIASEYAGPRYHR